jgi:hypothetical protein
LGFLQSQQDVKDSGLPLKIEKRALNETGALSNMAEPTGLEPAAPEQPD